MTELLVLELLENENLSGYDIQLLLQTSDAQTWGGVLVGSIYYALKQLQKDDYIEVAAVERTGRRQRAVYRITDRGRAYLNEQAVAALQSPTVSFPVRLYAGLNFLDHLDEEQSRAALESHRRELLQQKESLRQGRAEKAAAMGGTLPEVCAAVFDHMQAVLDQQIVLLERIMKLVGS